MENEITVYDKEKLFDNVYWFLCEQYTKRNPLHFVMFVGLDGELSHDVAEYILQHRYHTGSLQCIDYHSDKDVVEHLSQMRFGNVFLLNGLEKASTVGLIPIVRKIEEILYHNDKPEPLYIEGERTVDGIPVTIACDEFGTLIINTDNPNILPEYIRKHFGIITLEPGKQKRKMPRGQKKHYADQEEYIPFLREINNKGNGTLSLKQKANIAMSEMKGRKLFLDENGEPIYAKSTIRGHLSKLKKQPVLLSNLKNNGKVPKDNKITKK